MIPKKMEVLRRSYTDEQRELIEMIGMELDGVELPTKNPGGWTMEIQMLRQINELDGFLIRQELADAGWDGVFKLYSMMDERLVVFLPIRT